MKNVLDIQLAKDYCCTPAQVAGRENIFSVYKKEDGRRKFQEQEVLFLKIACIHGKLLVTGQKDIIEWCQNKYQQSDSAWFMEQSTLRELDEKLGEYGYQIGSAHPFYVAERASTVDTDGYELTWYHDEEIEQFRGDARFDEAFAFCKEAPDRIGVSVSEGNVILGMAGASQDSESMWQIGINVAPEARGRQLGVKLVTLLKNELLRQGILPFYGTSMSHIVSQRVAVLSGFIPAWAELYAEKK